METFWNTILDIGGLVVRVFVIALVVQTALHLIGVELQIPLVYPTLKYLLAIFGF